MFTRTALGAKRAMGGDGHVCMLETDLMGCGACKAPPKRDVREPGSPGSDEEKKNDQEDVRR